MSTIEDFKNAPTGATATHKEAGIRAMRTVSAGRSWVTSGGTHLTDKEMAFQGYMLEPPAPTTAREALEIAWELAHEVKPGQVIPDGARFMEFHNSVLKEYIAYGDREISYTLAPITRTVEPLSEPEWLDAPAVLAGFDGWSHDEREVFVQTGPHNHWTRVGSSLASHWSDLRDVTPLYPKETE